MRSRQQCFIIGFGKNFSKEFYGDICFNEPVAVFGESRGVPDGVLQVKPNKPAVEKIESDVFHERTLTADGKQDLQQQAFEQPFGRNAWPAIR